MKLLLIAAGIVVSALVALVARRRLSGGDISDTVEPVSGDWLAHARSHEDTQW